MIHVLFKQADWQFNKKNQGKISKTKKIKRNNFMKLILKIKTNFYSIDFFSYAASNIASVEYISRD